MAYTLCDQYGDCKPLRILAPNIQGEIEVKAEFTPHWWVCDPCNQQERRFEITYQEGGQPQYLPWYQVVLSDDTAEDVKCKVEFYKRVIAARSAMDSAAAEYRRLTGCGWSACPSV